MKGSAQAALALGVGYVLGRRRKMRLATVLAIGAAAGGAGRLGPAAAQRAIDYLGKTDIAGSLGPQAGEIIDTIRGDLLDAARSAATAAVTSRIDSLSDILHDRADALRHPEAASGTREAAGRAVGGLPRRQRLEGEEDTEQDLDEYEPELDDEYEPALDDDEYDSEMDDDYDSEMNDDEYDSEMDDDTGEEEAEEPAPRRRRASRSPVSRTPR